MQAQGTACKLMELHGSFCRQTLHMIRNVQGQTLHMIRNVQGQTLHMVGNVQGQTLHINLGYKTIEYHTDGTLHSTRNVQGQTPIKVIFNFVQGHSDTHSLTHSDKATLWIIELLTSQLKILIKPEILNKRKKSYFTFGEIGG